MSTPTASSPRPRPLALVVLDIIASVALLGFGAVFAVVIVGFAGAFGSLTSVCGEGPYPGIECNGTVLSSVVVAMLAVTIVGYMLGLGMVIVSLIRKRYTFIWPLGAIVVLVVTFYLASWVAGMTVPA